MELSGYNSDVLRIELEMSAREFWSGNFGQKLFTWPPYVHEMKMKTFYQAIGFHISNINDNFRHSYSGYGCCLFKCFFRPTAVIALKLQRSHSNFFFFSCSDSFNSSRYCWCEIFACWRSPSVNLTWHYLFFCLGKSGPEYQSSNHTVMRGTTFWHHQAAKPWLITGRGLCWQFPTTAGHVLSLSLAET